MGKRSSGCCQHLQEGVHVLSSVIIMFGVGMGHFDVAGKDILLLLQADYILLDSTKEESLELPEEHSWVKEPLSFRSRANY